MYSLVAALFVIAWIYLVLFILSAQSLGLMFCFVESEHGGNTFQG